jgi:hypothetical protein
MIINKEGKIQLATMPLEEERTRIETALKVCFDQLVEYRESDEERLEEYARKIHNRNELENLSDRDLKNILKSYKVDYGNHNRDQLIDLILFQSSKAA